MCLRENHATHPLCSIATPIVVVLGLLSVLILPMPSYPLLAVNTRLSSIPFFSSKGRFERRLSIRGTAIVGSRAVSEFRERLACFSESGRWAYNATPRQIPWCVLGEEDVWRTCDRRHRDESGGVFGAVADDIALGRGVGDWNVRQTLKYEWLVDDASCGWRRFDRKGFCRAIGLGRNILLVGDSMSWQLHVTFLNHMNTDVRNPIFGPEKQRTFCTAHRRLCSDVLGGQGFTLVHKRNVYLARGPWNRSEGDTLQQEWIETIHEEDIQIVVLNRGAWHVPDDRYVRELNATLVGLRERYPDLLIVFRNTPPGHRACESLPQKPLVNRQAIQGLPFHWGTFRHQNELARQLVEAVGGIYMDVDTMTALRPDGHLWYPERKQVDCLHYCMPGPLDLWMQLLYNIIHQSSQFATR